MPGREANLAVTREELCDGLFLCKAHDIRGDGIDLFRTQHNVWHRRMGVAQKDFDRDSVGRGHAADVNETRRPEFWIFRRGVWRELMTFAADSFDEMSANGWINLLRADWKH